MDNSHQEDHHEHSQQNNQEGDDESPENPDGVNNRIQQENILNNVERDIENGVQQRRNRTGNNLNPRDRLFYALFIKIGQLYASLVPKKIRTLLEVVVLLKVRPT